MTQDGNRGLGSRGTVNVATFFMGLFAFVFFMLAAVVFTTDAGIDMLVGLLGACCSAIMTHHGLTKVFKGERQLSDARHGADNVEEGLDGATKKPKGLQVSITGAEVTRQKTSLTAALNVQDDRTTNGRHGGDGRTPDASHEQIKALRAELAKSNERLREVQSSAQKASADAEQARKELVAAKAEVKDVRSQLKSAKDELRVAKKSIRDLQGEREEQSQTYVMGRYEGLASELSKHIEVIEPMFTSLNLRVISVSCRKSNDDGSLYLMAELCTVAGAQIKKGSYHLKANLYDADGILVAMDSAYINGEEFRGYDTLEMWKWPQHTLDRAVAGRLYITKN